MAFNGTYDAPDLTPSAFGLFSTTKPVTPSESDDRWLRGFAVDLESRPNIVRNWGDGTEEVLSTTLSDVKQYVEVVPFYVEVEDSASTFGALGLDRFKRIIRQVEAVTQKNVEREFWEGTIAQGETSPTPFLRGATCVTINGGTAVDPAKALAFLEFAVADASAAGEQGIIHMTRDVASVLGSQNLLRFENGAVETTTGTKVAIGSGYTGTGPLSAGAGAATTLTNRWMYATGTTGVHLGKSEVVNDELGQAYDIKGNKNDLKIKANRPVAAYFDPSIHLAVKVTLA